MPPVTASDEEDLEPPPIRRDLSLPVKMVVMDGIVMGHKCCSYDNCGDPLENTQTDVFCTKHKKLHKRKCHVKDCTRDHEPDTKVCRSKEHIALYLKHQTKWARQSPLAISRIITRTNQEGSLPWVKPQKRKQPQHDDEKAQKKETSKTKTYFSAGHIYCVETMVSPCGVPIAWTKMVKSESPTNILTFVMEVYPESERNKRPAYFCIDKGCIVLRTAITEAKWRPLLETSRFCVDSYHYLGHRTGDNLCRTWCNPTPLDGSGPNLVTVVEENGKAYYRRAFNTQVS